MIAAIYFLQLHRILFSSSLRIVFFYSSFIILRLFSLKSKRKEGEDKNKKRYSLSCLLFCFGLAACSKSNDANVNYQYYLNAYIQNVKYSTNSVSTFLLANQQGCVANKSYNLTNVGQINVDAYYLDCYFKYYTNNVDFVNTKPGAHKIFDGGALLTTADCNCDLVIGLVDNSIPNFFNNTVLQSTNIAHNVTAITKKDSTANSMTYLVTGNFSCNFKNTNNVIIPVVGNYAMPVKVAR
jgi:hypothetical protein